MTGTADLPEIPRRLLQRLDDLAGVLAGRGDALALIGLGSVGRDVDRLDDHSDLDFFAIVEDAAKQRYLDSIDWLEALAPVSYSFANTADGRKVLFADDLFAEYAVFTLDELRASSFPPGRLVWSRADVPPGIEEWGKVPRPSSREDAGHQLNEALTNVYVGLHREARGERLAAMRLIQVHAVDRLLRFLELQTESSTQRQDPFAIERGAERRFSAGVIPLARMVTGYGGNREAALAILMWIEERSEVNARLADAIRRLTANRP